MTFDALVPEDYDPDQLRLEFSLKHMQVCTRFTPHPIPVEGAEVEDWDTERVWELK
jgi:hypothetical protein